MHPIWTSALLFVWLAGSALAQPPAAPANADSKRTTKPDPNSLEGLIGDAMKSHADIRAAEAKVREAEAMLNQARFKVMQDVTAAHSAVQEAATIVKILEVVLTKTADLYKHGAASELDMQKAQLDVERARASLAKHEADLNLLVGRSKVQAHLTEVGLSGDLFTFRSHLRALNHFELFEPAQALLVRPSEIKVTAGSMSEKIRASLTTRVIVEGFTEALPIDEVITYLKQKARADIPIRLQFGKLPKSDGAVELMAGELPLSAWLVMIEDSVPGLVFVVREYGLLATTRDRIPEDALRIQEFLKRTEPKKEEKK